MSTELNNLGSRRPPKAYLLLENPRKSNNLGPILRCAAAFGISTVIAIGFSKCSVEGSHGASKYVEIIAFPTVNKAVASLRNECGNVSIVGILCGLPIIPSSGESESCTDPFQVCKDESNGLVQILQNGNPPGSLDILEARSWPVFAPNVFESGRDHCFVICKYKKGLTASLAVHCDKFVHVPCMDMGGGLYDPPLLDVPSCLSITLHHFAESAGYDERTFQGYKFELDKQRRKNAPKDSVSKENCARKEKEREMQEKTANETLESMGGFFEDGDGDY